jgi:high-affinity Fe2+/Pb2+ permease
MLFGGSAAEQPVRAWPWALSGALLGLAIGFALGVVLLDRHIRRKYGGLRIY